jgi:hypothetical protein
MAEQTLLFVGNPIGRRNSSCRLRLLGCTAECTTDSQEKSAEVEGSGCGLTDVVSMDLAGATEENQETLSQSIRSALRNSYGRKLLADDRLCGLVVRVLGYRSGGPGSIPGTTRKKMYWVWNGVHSAS